MLSDFGGSTFRVILVKLIANDSPVIKSTTIIMDNKMKSVAGEELFDHLAQCVADFVKKVMDLCFHAIMLIQIELRM